MAVDVLSETIDNVDPECPFFLALLFCTQQNSHARLIEEVRAHSCGGRHQLALLCAVRGVYMCTVDQQNFIRVVVVPHRVFPSVRKRVRSHDTKFALALQSRCPHCTCATVFKHRALELNATNSLTVASSAKKSGRPRTRFVCCASKQTTKDFTVLVLNQPSRSVSVIARCYHGYHGLEW
jgi:hypothetical protein